MTRFFFLDFYNTPINTLVKLFKLAKLEQRTSIRSSLSAPENRAVAWEPKGFFHFSKTFRHFGSAASANLSMASNGIYSLSNILEEKQKQGQVVQFKD